MKFHKKVLLSFTSVLLIAVLMMNLGFTSSETVRVSEPTFLLNTNDTIEVGTRDYSILEDLFTDSSYIEEDNVDGVRFYAEVNDDSGDVFDCTFNESTFQFTLIFSNDNTNEYSVETINATVNSEGGLNAIIEDGDDEYELDDYEDPDILAEMIDEAMSNGNSRRSTRLFGFLFRLAVKIFVYVVVASTAEAIKARSNYRHNQELDLSTPAYIYGQNTPYCQEYRYGFSNLRSAGCGVIAAYNARINMGDPENLSETVYKFEKSNIIITAAWGLFGTSPRKIYKYFDQENIPYTQYGDLNSFETALNNAPDGSHIIFSQWNGPSIFNGAHVFFVEKVSTSTYNYLTYNEFGNYTTAGEVSQFSDVYRGAFIYAYIF